MLLAVVKQDWLSPMQVWFAVDKEKKTATHMHVCDDAPCDAAVDARLALAGTLSLRY